MRFRNRFRSVVLLAGLAACGVDSGEEVPDNHGPPMPPAPALPEETTTPAGIHVTPDSTLQAENGS